MQSNVYELKIIIYAASRHFLAWLVRTATVSNPAPACTTRCGTPSYRYSRLIPWRGPAAPRLDLNARRRRRATSPDRSAETQRVSNPTPRFALHVTGRDAPHPDSLPTCHAKASFRMRRCIARSSHFYRAKFILKHRGRQRSIVAQTPAMTPRLSYEKGKVT